MKKMFHTTEWGLAKCSCGKWCMDLTGRSDMHTRAQERDSLMMANRYDSSVESVCVCVFA